MLGLATVDEFHLVTVRRPETRQNPPTVVDISLEIIIESSDNLWGSGQHNDNLGLSSRHAM